MKTSIIALLTDFGLADHYVGVMKAVVMSRAPYTRIIDISHNVPPHNIDGAAYLLWAAYKFFPRGTIFISVVDPGVGSKRRIVCVVGGGYIFLGPDNGSLKYIVGEIKNSKAYAVTEKNYFLQDVSTTFHGRDIFASVAGFLANGLDPSRLGRRITRLKSEHFISVNSVHRPMAGKIIHVDRFGNLITNFRWQLHHQKSRKRIGELKNFCLQFHSTRQIVSHFFRTYDDAPENVSFMTLGSSGLIEISVKKDSAAEFLGISQGERITLSRKNATR